MAGVANPERPLRGCDKISIIDDIENDRDRSGMIGCGKRRKCVTRGVQVCGGDEKVMYREV